MAAAHCMKSCRYKLRASDNVHIKHPIWRKSVISLPDGIVWVFQKLLASWDLTHNSLNTQWFCSTFSVYAIHCMVHFLHLDWFSVESLSYCSQTKFVCFGCFITSLFLYTRQAQVSYFECDCCFLTPLNLIKGQNAPQVNLNGLITAHWKPFVFKKQQKFTMCLKI